MIFPYGLRLVCLCLAAFFLVHTAAGLAVSALTAWALRIARRMAPAVGARVLLGLRLFPAGFALFVVAGLCTPSYLWLEPKGEPESTGLVCLAAALVSVAIWGEALLRGSRAVVRSRRYQKECGERRREARLSGEWQAAWVIDGPPCVVLAGILRPRMIISHSVMAALPAEQLSAVIRHERAHGMSHDNLKRLLVLLSPGIVPGLCGFRSLERAWVKLTEWAADDRAAGGKSRRSLSLAAALVSVARLGSMAEVPALGASLMSQGVDLSERVDRLLHPARRAANSTDREPLLAASAGLLLTGALIAVIAHPVTLHSAHEFLELLIQ